MRRARSREPGLDALIAIGGEDTLGVGAPARRRADVPVVGVPKTIDNDLAGTDFTFGFDTAVQIATDAIDRLHTTAESHDRVIVVEVMGRHAGWIACHSGIAGGADVDPDPRAPVRHRRRVRASCAPPRARPVVLDRRRRARAPARRGLAGDDETPRSTSSATSASAAIGERLARGEIEQRTGYETRMVVLGHVQRGGTPTAFDRVLATRYGTRAAEVVAEGGFGRMVAILGNTITDIPLSDAVSELKTVPESVYGKAELVIAGP